MRQSIVLAAAAAALISFGTAKAADFYVEPAGTAGTTPPPAGTQEFVFDSFGFSPYVADNATAGRVIGGQPLIDFSGNDGPKQIQPSLKNNGTNGAGGDVDLFQVNVATPQFFAAWTSRTGTAPANTILLTLFKADGTAVAATLGGVQSAGTSLFTLFGATPVNPNDPGIMKGPALGLTPGNYYLGVSNYVAANGKGQPKNDAGQNIFTPVVGSVVTPNALADIKLSTDPLKAWDLFSTDTAPVGAFNATTGTGDGDQLLGKTSFTSGAASNINVVLVPEPTIGLAMGIAGLATMARRRRV